jgi:signal transduction histidine kinase
MNNRLSLALRILEKGINPEILPRLFSKYATKFFEGNGLGFGLFICKSIVESHGGKIWAENNNNTDSKEKGAKFTFNLPLIRSQKTNKMIGADN